MVRIEAAWCDVILELVETGAAVVGCLFDFVRERELPITSVLGPQFKE